MKFAEGVQGVYWVKILGGASIGLRLRVIAACVNEFIKQRESLRSWLEMKVRGVFAGCKDLC